MISRRELTTNVSSGSGTFHALSPRTRIAPLFPTVRHPQVSKKKLRPFVSAAMQSLITPYKPRALHMVADPTLTAQRAIVLSVNG
jgi:hypothetical protein